MTMLRKVIRIRASDSPNVQLGLEEEARGLEPSHRELVPGVLSYALYKQRRRLWDEVKQSIGLDGEFYTGGTTNLFPADWLNIAEQKADELSKLRPGTAMGVDTAEGGDSTSWAIADHHGLIKLYSMKTPDTNVIPGMTLAYAKQHKVPTKNIMFDTGGGGGIHVDSLRAKGYRVREVSFGESVNEEQKPGKRPVQEKNEEKRDRYEYKNRRAQMYHLLRLRLDPKYNRPEKDTTSPNTRYSFGIPAEYTELRKQLKPIPLTYDEEGRLYLLPKKTKPESKVESLEKLLGRSPDDADALVMAVYVLETAHAPRLGTSSYD